MIEAEPFGKTLEESMREAGQWQEPTTMEEEFPGLEPVDSGIETTTMEIVTENNVAGTSFQSSSTGLNSRSFSEWSVGRRWNKKDTALFFLALQCFGTDFDLMAKCFPNRDKRSLSNKLRSVQKSVGNKARLQHALDNPIDPKTIPEFRDQWEQINLESEDIQAMPLEELLQEEVVEQVTRTAAGGTGRAGLIGADMAAMDPLNAPDGDLDDDYFGF